MDNETCQVTSDACSNGSSAAVTVPTVDHFNDVREERATKKGRRKGSKGKNDDNWRYCVQNCIHSGKSPNELVQCHLCQSWIHPECAGEDGKDIVGIWTCTSCRQLPVLVSHLLEKTSALESLVDKLTSSNQQHVTIAEQQCDEMPKLRDVVANASQLPSVVTNISDAKSKPTTLLVGDSRLRDVHLGDNASGNPIRTRVKSGARFNDIGEMVDDAAKTSSIGAFIIVGGAREMKEDENADLINDEVVKLLQKAKSVTQCAKMSCILPSKNTPNSERLSDLNTKVRSTRVDHDVLFVDNDVNITFRNGAVDDAAFQRDGIHLSRAALPGCYAISIFRNSLSDVNNGSGTRVHGVRRSVSTKTINNSDVTQELTRDDTQRDDNEWRVVSRRRSTQNRRTPGQCAKCGESNHVTARCKHAGHVQCRQSGQLGHREKYHSWD